MANIFTLVENNQTGFQNNLRLAKKAAFAGELGGNIDVIRKFPWTLTPITEKVAEEVPYIRLKEFYLLDRYINQLFQAYGLRVDPKILVSQETFEDTFDQFVAIPGAGTDLLYEGLYDLNNYTGFTYTIPFFNTDYLSTVNAWTASPMFNQLLNLQKKISGTSAGLAALGGQAALKGILTLVSLLPQARIARLAAAGAGLAMQDPVGRAQAVMEGVEKSIDFAANYELLKTGLESPIASLEDPAIDKPHLWSGTSPRSYTITFTLFNTLDNNPNDKKKWYDQIVNNWELCYLLCYQNLYNKRNLFTGIPPVFYEVTIPGVYYTKAAYVSEMNILNVGNIRTMQLPINENGGTKEVNVPDAYQINMTLTDFFMPSKNFMDTIETPGNRGRVVDSFNKIKSTEITKPEGDTSIQDYYNRTAEGIAFPQFGP